MSHFVEHTLICLAPYSNHLRDFASVTESSAAVAVASSDVASGWSAAWHCLSEMVLANSSSARIQ